MGDKRSGWGRLGCPLASLYDLRESPSDFPSIAVEANNEPDLIQPLQMHPQESDRFGMPTFYPSESLTSHPGD